jgi:DNA-binding NtrC family response regulator
MHKSILVVDDNEAVRVSLKYLLKKMFEKVVLIDNPDAIQKTMASESFSVILLDMNFALGLNTGNEGLFWLEQIKRLHPKTPVVLFTAYGDIELAVKGLKRGASDFITKPWDNDELVHKLKDVLDMQSEIVSLDEMEKEHIRRTIDHCHGNLTQAAELLGITRQTLYNKMKRL